MNSENIKQALAPFGLKLRGIAALSPDEKQVYGFTANTVALVGNIGSSFWPVFRQSREYADGKANPLDRWSLRLAKQIAPRLNATPVFPFQGPPYLPFQQWAKRAETLQQSPIGLMMHPQYGLWHAYRFGLLLTEPIASTIVQQDSPCLSCSEQPCLNTCPVNAFSDSGYDIARCAQYLQQTSATDCARHGCMARYECPAGRNYRYIDEQSQFHLQTFLSAG